MSDVPVTTEPDVLDISEALKAIGKPVRMKVNGEYKTFEPTALAELASKGLGADEKFRAAADKEKELASQLSELEQARQFNADLKTVNAFTGEDDPKIREAFIRIGKLNGQTAEQASALFDRAIQAASSQLPDPEEERSKRPPPAPAPQVPQDLLKLAEALKEAGLSPKDLAQYVAEKAARERQTAAENLIYQEVDKSEKLATLLARGDKVRSGMRQAVRDEVERMVRADPGLRLTPATIQTAINKVGGLADVLVEGLHQKVETPVDLTSPFGFSEASRLTFDGIHAPERPSYKEGDDLGSYIEKLASYNAWQEQQGK